MNIIPIANEIDETMLPQIEAKQNRKFRRKQNRIAAADAIAADNSEKR